MTAQQNVSARGATVERILDAAERRMRRVGYNAVSFRDLAADIGVKSASIHYHFPRKEDLAHALVARYSERFAARLDDASRHGGSAMERLEAFVDLHRKALDVDGAICLCGMLGAEASSLPPTIRTQLAVFFDANVAWLAALFREAGLGDPEAKAANAVAGLEGALIVASACGNPRRFEQMAAHVAEFLR